MDEVKDQVQQDNQPEEAPKGPKVLKKEPKVSQAEPVQSETTQVAEEAKPQVFKDHLGRDLTAEQLYEEYSKTQSYVSKLEKERLEWEKKAQTEAAKAVSENTLLKDVDPNVREAIVQIVTPVIEDSLRRRDADAQKRAQDEAFTRRLDELKAKYPGGNGLPKFDEVKVLAAMRDPSNSIFDPEWKFRELNYTAFMDYEIKQAMKGKSSTVETESTGGSHPKKPESNKTPRTLEEAGRNALSRIPE